MSRLEQAVERALAQAAHGRMNETNTRVLLIEPILEALGWNTRDLDAVTREYKVYDGTFLDYALLANGRPVLFVEAKALGSHLLDPKWVAQTINYANNEGVVWCALTDGRRYSVYKTNEPVDMARKLVFEIDLGDVNDDHEGPGVLRRLALLSRVSVLEGELDALGARLFDDSAVRATLSTLFSDPPTRFVNLIRDHLPDRERPLDRRSIKASLMRIGRGIVDTKGLVEPAEVVTPSKPKARRAPRKRRTYTLNEHFGNTPAEIVDLYNQLHERISALGEDIERIPKKQYVGYNVGKKVVCSVIPQKSRLRLVLPLDPGPLESHRLTRDISEVGHWGVGDLEVTYDTEESLDQIMEWVRTAVTAARS